MAETQVTGTSECYSCVLGCFRAIKLDTENTSGADIITGAEGFTHACATILAAASFNPVLN